MSRQEDVLLSVITVTYRDPVGLHATCESLRPLSGMGIRWEQVIVDSSPELNQDAVREFGALWPIRHLALPAEGIYPAMNDGMRGATGEFAWYLNGGDRLKSPELLKQMLDRFRNQPAIDLLCAGADLTRGGRALYPRVPKPDFLENLTAENLLVHPAMIYRRSAWARVGPYTPKFRLAADYEHHLRCFLAQLRAECVSEPLIEFDMSGTSTRIDQAIRERREILQSLAPKISPEIRTRFEVGLRRETRRLRVIQGFGPFKAILRPLWVAMKRRGRSQSGQSVTPILGVPISNLGMEEALSACLERANQRKGGYACFSNVHTVTESLSNLGLRRSLSAASFAFADGLPLVWVSRLKRAAVHSRVCGPDFMREFLRRAAALEQGFIGGSPGQAEAIAQALATKAICYSPPYRPFSVENAREDWKAFLAAVPGGRAPAVVWVGLGAPKQELWMAAVSEIAPDTLFFGVGAAFDFLSGTKRRAPTWMQKMGLEWLFRLFQEPGRLWKRYFVTNSLFLACVFLEMLGIQVHANPHRP